MRPLFLTSLLCLTSVALVLHPLSLYAAPKKRGEVQCPEIIVNNKTGEFLRNKKRKNSLVPYRCFDSSVHAAQAGFSSVKSNSATTFTGWWRLRFTQVSDNCGVTIPGQGGPTLFVQVGDYSPAVYADFCPSLGALYGLRTGNGFVATQIETVKESDNNLHCSNGMIERVRHFEMRRESVRSEDDKSAYATTLTISRRCTVPGEGAKRCATSYTGIAFAETHTIWPVVSRDSSAFANSCTKALTTCGECHEGL